MKLAAQHVMRATFLLVVVLLASCGDSGPTDPPPPPPPAPAASVTVTGNGNLVLHEVCKNEPPVETLYLLTAENEKSLEVKGNGLLPLHYACSSGASAEVVKFLIDSSPQTVEVAEQKDGLLPIHHACKVGTTEDALMALLIAYPQAIDVRDDFGYIPLDYAKNLHEERSREMAVSCLKRGQWLCDTAQQYRKKCRKEVEDEMAELRRLHSKEITLIKEEATKKEEEHTMSLQHLQNEQQDEIVKLMETIQIHLGKEGSLQRTVNKLQQEIGAMKVSSEETVGLTNAIEEKTKEVEGISSALAREQTQNGVLRDQLKRKKKLYSLALAEIQRLTTKLQSVDSLMNSIRHLAKAPMVASEMRDAPEDFNYATVDAKNRPADFTPEHSTESELEVAQPLSKKAISGPLLTSRGSDEMYRQLDESRTEVEACRE